MMKSIGESFRHDDKTHRRVITDVMMKSSRPSASHYRCDDKVLRAISELFRHGVKIFRAIGESFGHDDKVLQAIGESLPTR
ncbi:hypothetical protein GQ457_13G011100 [Hibiscus cannabinus]